MCFYHIPEVGLLSFDAGGALSFGAIESLPENRPYVSMSANGILRVPNRGEHHNPVAPVSPAHSWVDRRSDIQQAHLTSAECLICFHCDNALYFQGLLELDSIAFATRGSIRVTAAHRWPSALKPTRAVGSCNFADLLRGMHLSIRQRSMRPAPVTETGTEKSPTASSPENASTEINRSPTNVLPSLSGSNMIRTDASPFAGMETLAGSSDRQSHDTTHREIETADGIKFRTGTVRISIPLPCATQPRFTDEKDNLGLLSDREHLSELSRESQPPATITTTTMAWDML
jgi:hypothetical protein